MSLTPNGSPVEAAGIEHIDGLYSYALVLTRNRSEPEDRSLEMRMTRPQSFASILGK